MDYENRYKEALTYVEDLVKHNVISKENAEKYFPELKESEDEKIRKEILDYIDKATGCKRWIAWLEQQGDVNKDTYEIAEKEKKDFVSVPIECRASFDEFEEDNSYQFEYIGNDTYIGKSDNILNKKFHITPRQLFTLFTQQHHYHCPKEEEANAPSGYGKYVDECLYDASKHFFSEGEDKYSVADLFYAGVRCGKNWIERQKEEEQKFYSIVQIPDGCHAYIKDRKIYIENYTEKL